MCIDRHILVVNLFANSENGYKAGEGIFKLPWYNCKKKVIVRKFIFFVNYIAKPRGTK